MNQTLLELAFIFLAGGGGGNLLLRQTLIDIDHLTPALDSLTKKAFWIDIVISVGLLILSAFIR